jgi:hypothetical protein
VYYLRDGVRGYEDSFIQTTQGTFILPSVVPDKAKFTIFVQGIRTIRGDARPGCSVNLKINGDIEDDRFKLLRASYDASDSDKNSINSILDIHPDPISSEHSASLLSIEEDRIRFRLDEAVHAAVRENLVWWYEGSDDERDGEDALEGSDFEDIM